jgi:penicillin-insensitive murein endopeptidase
VPDGDGCGHALDFWFRQATLHPAPPPSPAQPKPGVSLAALPAACKQIVMAP